MNNTIFYRYETRSYGDGIKVDLCEWKLLRPTPKGFWIVPANLPMETFKKWVSKESKKRFAYPTKEEAQENYIKRTERRIEILEWQMDVSRQGLTKAERIFNNPPAKI